MPVILESAAVRNRVVPISLDWYHQLINKGELNQQYELLGGVIVEKMFKSPLHTAIVARLLERLERALSHGAFVRKEEPLTTADSEPEPDLAVVTGSPEDFFDHHPQTALLVVEVAVSSGQIDRDKAAIYAATGVDEYWIVLPEEGEIEVLSQARGDCYLKSSICDGTQTVSSSSIPGFSVEIPALFQRPRA